MTLHLKNLVLTRPLAAVDVETTGTDVRADRVVEVAVLRVRPDGTTDPFVRRVNPGRPIPAAATAVHGITDADVAVAPPFAAVAADLLAALGGCDLVGFGIASFDLPILVTEFTRAGVPFRVAGRTVIDALAVYHRHEPRDLASAVRFYTGVGHPAAHSAAADAAAALAVLDAQVGRYGLARTPEELHAAGGGVDAAGVFRRDDAGALVFGLGKYRGRALAGVAAADRGYLEWFLRQDFLDDARDLVREALE